AADGQVRPLRLLPADVSELCAARPGNGLSAGTHLLDACGHRRARADGSVGRTALRYLPRVHGVRDGLSIWCQVRAAHRADTSGHRKPASSFIRRTVVPATALLSAAISRPLAAACGSACDGRTGSPLARDAETPASKATQHADAGAISSALGDTPR